MKKLICTVIFIFVNLLSLNCFANETGYIIKLKENTVSLFGSIDSSSLALSDESLRVVNEDEKIFAVENLEDITEYLDNDLIECIEPDFEVSLLDIPNDTYYSKYQWNMELINAPTAWETGCYGQDIKVAVIDSGANPHDDLTGNLLEGYNYIDNNTDVTDATGHGTFVSGIIAAVGNNSNAFAGLAYRAKIVPLKTFKSEKTNVSYIISAVRDAVDKYGCKVINLSLGDTKNSSLLEEAVNHAISKGAIVIAASGNSGTDAIYYPASYQNVISVGSVDSDKVIDATSTHNAYVDVVAPGKDVYSLLYDDKSKIGTGSGTSFATPHVSALAAIALNINPELNCSDFSSILHHTAEDLGDAGRDDYYGYGLIDTKKVLKILLNGIDYFVSPFDYEDENPSAVIYNNTSKQKSFLSIFKDSASVKLTKNDISANSGTHVYFDTTDKSFTHYLWETNLCPVLKNIFTNPQNDASDSDDTDNGEASGEEETTPSENETTTEETETPSTENTIEN